ncbi:hypothetical protein cyc_09119 [Cyclospora cayetanensis]|uniref:Uncharacterized protein n=1 Tax=Cyclospora cayetanensis TaxID=88456 RepID=A0A1D3CUN5_9EIME|nr:hypothetical protein cyc_09119 [Cyclospora cayetanensis]
MFDNYLLEQTNAAASAARRICVRDSQGLWASRCGCDRCRCVSEEQKHATAEGAAAADDALISEAAHSEPLPFLANVGSSSDSSCFATPARHQQRSQQADACCRGRPTGCQEPQLALQPSRQPLQLGMIAAPQTPRQSPQHSSSASPPFDSGRASSPAA